MHRRQFGDLFLVPAGCGHFKYHQSISAFFDHRRKGPLEIGVDAFNFEYLRPQPKHTCRRIICPFYRTPVGIRGRVGDVWITQDRHACELREQLMEQFELFPGLLRVVAGYPRCISTWLLHRGDDPDGNWIDDHRKDYRNFRGCFLSCPSPYDAERHNDVYVKTSQFDGKIGDPVELSLGKSRLEDDVPALDIAEFTKILSKRIEIWLWASVGDYPDARKFGFLLRDGLAGRQPQSKAEYDRAQCEQLLAPHVVLLGCWCKRICLRSARCLQFGHGISVARGLGLNYNLEKAKSRSFGY